MAAKGDSSLIRPSVALPSLGTGIGVAAAGIVVGLLFAATLQVAGPLGVAALAAAAAGLILLRFPAAALAILLVSTVLVETADIGLLPPVDTFYDVIGASLTLQDMLLIAGLAGVLLRFVTENRRPRLPEPLSLPLALLALATVAGAATGYYSDSGGSLADLFHRSVNLSYLILVPLLVVNVVRDTRGLRLFVGATAALAAIKGLSGAYGALAGTGEAVDQETASFLDPLPNLMTLALILGVTAALIRRVRLPAWALAAAPFAAIALVLSYRRSFWIAAVFALIVIAIVASRRRGRLVMALGSIVVVGALAMSLTVGSSDTATSPLAERAQTLNPSGANTNRGDRYRIDERRNVIETLRERPLTGTGLGVPWKASYPLAEDHDRRYVHLAVLWYWLSLGVLGAVAYLVLMGAGLWTAVNVWRRHPDALVKIGAITCFGAILALFVVELTTTFTGVEPRISIAVGAALGWLAAAWADIPRRERKVPPIVAPRGSPS